MYYVKIPFGACNAKTFYMSENTDMGMYMYIVHMKPLIHMLHLCIAQRKQ